MQVSFDIGVAANTYQYSPFGQHLDAQLRFISFSSEYYDPTTDLYYYNYRYYNPFYNKWIDRDPIAEDGGINVYAMLMNNPIGMTDALGLICCNGIETGDDECCFNDEIMTMDLDIQANEGGKCCINLIKICLTTKKLVHQNIAIGDSVFSYGLDNNFYLLIFPQFWDSASVYIDVKGKEIECFNVKKSVATVLASEMYKMTNTNTCERGPYGLPNWGEHGGNCRAFSQAFYNEFKKQEYTGDLPQCEED